MSQKRIYGEPVKIDYLKTKLFWNNRAMVSTSNESVLLGKGLQPNSAELRNLKEKSILLNQIGENFKFNILDIGCGIGRWVENLTGYIDCYHGIDFSNELIRISNLRYKSTKNIRFYEMSATKMDERILSRKYNLIIVNGLLMYINDDQISDLFNNINQMIARDGIIYLQESVSTIGQRLSLDDYYSDDLSSNYSAIYRTTKEYNRIIDSKLTNFRVMESDLLLDKATGSRKETNAQYWIIK